jgi:hypothetical protein
MTTQKLFYKKINYLILWKLPGFYPQGFDGYGHIDRLDMDEIVIDDSLLKLAYNVRYNTPRRKNTTDSDFGVGNVVGYLVNGEGQVVSLWLIMARVRWCLCG